MKFCALSEAMEARAQASAKKLEDRVLVRLVEMMGRMVPSQSSTGRLPYKQGIYLMMCTRDRANARGSEYAGQS